MHVCKGSKSVVFRGALARSCVRCHWGAVACLVLSFLVCMSGVEQLQTLVTRIEQMSVDSAMYEKLLQHLQAQEQVLIQNLPQLASPFNCAESL